MTDIIQNWNMPTREMPHVPGAQGGPNYADRADVARRVVDSVAMAVPKGDGKEGDEREAEAKDPYATSNDTLAKWLKAGKIDESTYRVAMRQPPEAAEAPAEPTTAPAAAAKAASAIQAERPVDTVSAPVDETGAAEPAAVVVEGAEAEKAAPVNRAEEPETALDDAEVTALAESVEDVVAEQLGSQIAAAEPEEVKGITYRAARKEANRQLKKEQPGLTPTERRQAARAIAYLVKPPKGNLRRRAVELMLRVGVGAEMAKHAAVETVQQPERNRLKLIAGAAGIITTYAAGIYFIYKGINDTVSTIPNLEVFKYNAPVDQHDSGIFIAGR